MIELASPFAEVAAVVALAVGVVGLLLKQPRH
jgi:hypothetical protein